MTATIPQLRMGFTRFDTLVPPQLAAGYGFRTFRPGDEEAWIALLNTGSFGIWHRARLDEFLGGTRGVVPHASIFFVTVDDMPVGSACLVLHPQEDGTTIHEVGWVVVHPTHQGHHLGHYLCSAVLLRVRDRGDEYAYLLTEDFRLPAIKTYLRLGFVPEMIDPVHPAWWAETQRRLMDDATSS